jgi:aspartate/methionine/tyrosine aminotransferase
LTHALPRARDAVRELRASKIREVANAGMGRDDVLAFWFGEPDEVTPGFIRQAGIAALDAGETFYTHNLGIVELRQSIAAYVARLHGSTDIDRIAVTNSGMSALMLVTQALVGAGDRAVAVTPLWPNLVEIPKILGANVECVQLAFRNDGWTLDVDRLARSAAPENARGLHQFPEQPHRLDSRGGRAARDPCALPPARDLDHRRRRVRAALLRGRSECLPAPSFLDLSQPDDRVISTNTFSKSWLMTGWRLGWIVAPPALVPDLAKLLEYNTSCAPPFVQRAGVVAVEQGERVIAHTVGRLRHARDFLHARLAELPGVAAVAPPGAMYAFFQVSGVRDSLEFCKRLVADAGLGLAPGIAFGPEGEGFVRWCFASAESRLADGVGRLRRFLADYCAT